MTSHQTADYTKQSLRQIEFKGLFGHIDHEFSLDEHFPTILTGRNGSGKSTILRLINAISNGDLLQINNAPVDYIRLSFNAGPDFILHRIGPETTIRWGSNEFQIQPLNQRTSMPEWLSEAWESRDFDLSKVQSDLVEIARSNRVPYDEYTAIRKQLLDGEFLQSEFFKKPDWIDKFTLGFPVLYIADQRLISESTNKDDRTFRSRTPTRRAVEHASKEIADKLRSADSGYARTAQITDRKLAEKLIKRMRSNAGNVEASSVVSLIEKVDERRKILQNVGLLDESNTPGVSFQNSGFDDPSIRSVVQVVMESTLDNLEVFDSLEARLTAFKGFLDRRLHPKKLELDRKHGMRFSVPGRAPVTPSKLSSGEQQITVLAYEILFRTEPSTLVMIDEPEISLHVSWQTSLVDDLQEMGRAASVQFLLATHSPMILGGHPGLERELSGREIGA